MVTSKMFDKEKGEKRKAAEAKVFDGEINGLAQITAKLEILPRELFNKNMEKNFLLLPFVLNKNFPGSPFFFNNFREENFAHTMKFLPLQTKGKKVLIAFCMAIKKLLEESQPGWK